LEFPFNIPATADASDFKFGMQLGFAKSHHKITAGEKSARGSGLGKLPKILGFPFNTSATAEPSDLKFGMKLEFANGHHEITPRRKSGRGRGVGELPNILEFPLIFLQQLRLAI